MDLYLRRSGIGQLDIGLGSGARSKDMQITTGEEGTPAIVRYSARH